MKYINGIQIVVLTMLMACCNLFAAAGEPLQFPGGVYDVEGYRFHLWKPNLQPSYECPELTKEEAQAWFPPRPEVVDWNHYEQWERHVATVFSWPSHARAECDTSNALAMIKRDYAWFIEHNPQLGTPASECDKLLDVPISLIKNLRTGGNYLLMHPPEKGDALAEHEKKFTASRVNKIEQYRIGLLAEINGRALCPQINCRFMSVQTYSGLPYIYATAEPQKAWESYTEFEDRHVIPESKKTMLGYFDTYILENQDMQAIDYERAREALDRYREISNTFQVRIDTVTRPVHTVTIPVIVDEINDLITVQSGQLTLSNNTAAVFKILAKRFAIIRRYKDINFFRQQLQNAHVVPRAMQGNTVVIREAPEDEQPIPSPIQMTAIANIAARTNMQPIPSTFYNVLYPSWWRGFFAGLGWTGLTWAALYRLTPYIRSSHESIGAAACIINTVTACMPYLYAHRKVAQSDSNLIFSDGICNGAHIGMIVGLGMNLARMKDAS